MKNVLYHQGMVGSSHIVESRLAGVAIMHVL